MSSISIPTSLTGSKVPLQENKVLFVWSFTVWLVVMNTTMFNVALPTVLADFSLTSTTASWIVSGYSIAFAISTLTYSRLSDFVPISRLLFIGLSLLSAASIIGFLSHQFYGLLAARILQAAGAGAVPGLAMVLAGRYIPLCRRGKAMSFIASAASLGFGLGPVIGGSITQYLGWHFLFGITGLVVFFIPLFKKLLPVEDAKTGNFDFFGAILTGLSITGCLLFISTFSYAILGSTIILIAILWKYLHRHVTPFIQPVLLKNVQFLKLIMIGFTGFIVHFSTLFLIPIILTLVFHKGATAVGFIIFPGAILAAIAAQWIGRLIDLFGNKPAIFTGQCLLIIATVLFAFTSTISPYCILFTYIFMSIGFSTLTSSISNEVTRLLSTSEIGSGMGLAQLTQFIGGGFGVTLTGLFLTIQKGLPYEIIYRNIFFILLFILLSGIISFVFYFLGQSMSTKWNRNL
jgi:DHA2 family metal-tetracycline-proton antiporter-like MFS transporter